MISFAIIAFAFLGVIFFTYKSQRLIKSGESKLLYLRNGVVCYSCGDEIIEDEAFMLSIEAEDYRICTACKREEDIDGLLNRGRVKMKNRFILQLIDQKRFRIYSIVNFTAVLSLIVVGIFTGTKYLSVAVNLMNFIYCALIYLRARLTTEERKK